MTDGVGSLEWLLNNSKDPEETLRLIEELDQLLKEEGYD